MAEANCVAYGTDPDAPRGCFFVGTECHTLGGTQCRNRMADERQRVYRGMSESAAAGDPLWASVLEEIHSPDDLLGGRD